YFHLKNRISSSFFNNIYSYQKICLLIILSTLFVGASFYFLSRTTVSIANYLPESIHRTLGDYSERLLVTYSKNEILENDSLNKIIKHLSHSTGLNQSFKIYIINSNEPPNAFAIANGKIFIYKSLIDSAASADELIGIIAHEMAHVIKHHSTVNVIRYLGLSLIIKASFGIDNQYHVADFLFKPYSQELETEADTIAADILFKSGVSISGLKAFFSRKKDEDDDSVISRFLSTHPSSEARLNNLKDLASIKISKPILTKNEWQELKKSCNITERLNDRSS
ncbi:MAG TPA: M48 family metallopeptidase, partial [Gammaproteobacteria bacterium]|nr:M48 family metallopeptidase [Gammaproteobacteria bacterium]